MYVGEGGAIQTSLFNKLIPFYICELAGKRLSFSTNLVIIQSYLLKVSPPKAYSLWLLLWTFPFHRLVLHPCDWPTTTHHMLSFLIFGWASHGTAKTFPRWPCKATMPGLHFICKGQSKMLWLRSHHFRTRQRKIHTGIVLPHKIGLNQRKAVQWTESGLLCCAFLMCTSTYLLAGLLTY